MQGIFYLLVVACVVLFVVAQHQGEGEAPAVAKNQEILFSIEHSFDSINFTPRTKVQLVTLPDGKQKLVFPEKNEIVGTDVTLLKNLLDSNSLYTIRIQTNVGEVATPPIVSSLPMVSCLYIFL
jgi:hypothetical protein